MIPGPESSDTGPDPGILVAAPPTPPDTPNPPPTPTRPPGLTPVRHRLSRPLDAPAGTPDAPASRPARRLRAPRLTGRPPLRRSGRPTRMSRPTTPSRHTHLRAPPRGPPGVAPSAPTLHPTPATVSPTLPSPLRHPEFPHYAFIRETFERGPRMRMRRTGPWYYFLPILLLGAFPWVTVSGRSPRLRSSRHPPRCSDLWVLLPTLFFSISQPNAPVIFCRSYPRWRCSALGCCSFRLAACITSSGSRPGAGRGRAALLFAGDGSRHDPRAPGRRR